MKKGLGIVLTLIGIAATAITGMQVADDSDSFSIFGADVVVSQANYVPLIISVVVLVIGIILWSNSSKK
ncbi:hypothetical protein WJR50_26385 [Catalinimonas sp. 4WD22]|uniref:hypothetical protein n=1 Tax=Catalinimonas locisalis TaxID=3133978 RepID=UPI0031018B48